ncbi:dienelactone hydrolase family protein [candidate division KSB1 bacterium]|nr:dienelactone hydrolase family protein [candidate division KSB1 bacterium]
MSARVCIYFYSISLLLSCGRSYDHIPPRQVTAGEIHFQGTQGEPVQNTFLYSVPQNYDPGNSYPMIVTLHGGGSNATAFHDLWKSTTDSLGFVLLTPRGDVENETGIGRRWGENAERSVMISIDIVRKAAHVDPGRIYIAGFSSGGKTAYYLGLKCANLFHGFAALGAPLEKNVFHKNKIFPNKQKIYIAHGSLETQIAEKSTPVIDELKNHGAAVEYVQYQGIGHTLPEPKEHELGRILNYLDTQ